MSGTFFGGDFFGGEFFGGEFFTADVEPPVVEVAPAVVGGGRPHRRRIPRYIRVGDEPEASQSAVVPIQEETARAAMRLPELTSFEAGIVPAHIDMLNNSGIRGKTVIHEWDEEDEWLLMH